jgi:predicted Zn-dependent protease
VSRGRDANRLSIEYQEYNQKIASPSAPTGARPLRDAQFPDAACTGSELASCLEAQSAIAGSHSCNGTERRICVVPFGQISPELVDHLVQTYSAQCGLTVKVLAPASIPADLVDPEREQVDADGLINHMGMLFPAAYDDPQVVLIGLTVVDLYDATSHFRYVFGLKGSYVDPRAVGSTFRMDPLFYSGPQDDALLYSRFRKLVSKYIGLLYYDLPSSPDPTSPMYNSILGPDDVDTMTEPLPVCQ